MKLEALVLNGGGILCCSYLGCLQYLFEEKLVKEDLSSLKEIYCLSGGIIYILPLLLGLSFKETTEFFLKLDETKITPIESMSVRSLFENYGFFTNKYLSHCFKYILKHMGKSIHMTLKELYELNSIRLIVKVVNISKNQELFIDYKTHPDITLITLLEMTTCIPLYFEPIKYKGDYYVDGGLTGRIIKKDIVSKNYLSIYNSYEEKHPRNLFEFFINVMFTAVERDTSDKKRELKIIHKKHGALSFEMGIKGKRELILLGYMKMKEKLSKLQCKPFVVPRNHKRHQTMQKNSSEIVSHKWKSIVYHYLVSKNHP